MTTNRARRRGAVLWVAASLAVATTACATAARKSPPASGRVTVGVTTRGPGADAMTLTVSIEPAGIEGSVKGDVGVFTADDTPAGSQIVRLKNVPARCRVDGDSDRKITVSAGGSTTVRFVVVCT